MKFASVTQRLQGGGAKWELHMWSRQMVNAGHDVIEMTIGEPDVPMPTDLVTTAIDAIQSGSTKYADGQGEIGLRQALADHYTTQSDRDNVLCFLGTQTGLYAAIASVAEAGDEVIVGDPMYATYEGVVRSCGANMVVVPLRAKHGFRMQAADIAEGVTERTRAILLTTPHNPTGVIPSAEDNRAIGELARQHDLWIVADEVYAGLVFDGEAYASGLSHSEFADRIANFGQTLFAGGKCAACLGCMAVEEDVT